MNFRSKLFLSPKCLSLLAMSALACTFLAGCLGSSEGNKSVKMQTSRLRTFVGLYNAAANDMRRLPADKEELKAFIEERRPTKAMERLGLDSVDELFISERDEQPFAVFYGKLPQGVDNEVAAYEQTGVDGKRWVGMRLGDIEEVDEQQFRELVPAGAEPK